MMVMMMIMMMLVCGYILHRSAWLDLQYRDVLRWIQEMLWNGSREPRGRESLVAVTVYEWLRVRILQNTRASEKGKKERNRDQKIC